MVDDVKGIKEELYKTFDKSFIEAYGELIYGMALRFYNNKQLKGKVFFDEKIFSGCLIDILVDLERLKYFHELDDISYERLIAYAASWIIKRKPFQIINSSATYEDKKCCYINEKFAFFLLMDGCGFDSDRRKAIKGKNKELKGYFRKIFYHIQYRNTSPRTLELLLCGIECGLCIIDE